MNEITAAALEFLAMAARARIAETQVRQLTDEITKLQEQIEKLTPKPVEEKKE